MTSCEVYADPSRKGTKIFSQRETMLYPCGAIGYTLCYALSFSTFLAISVITSNPKSVNILSSLIKSYFSKS